MDAVEFFREVVEPNFQEFRKAPSNFRLLWNALVSMNTVAEFVTLERIEYADISKHALATEANLLRDKSLADLKFCAETLKHVRKIEDNKKYDRGFELTASSTGVAPNDRTTWKVGELDLVEVVHRAFATLSTFREFN